jgi:hypothetical protein
VVKSSIRVACSFVFCTCIPGFVQSEKARALLFTAVIVAGLLFVLMVVSGSLLSLGKARNKGMVALHNVGSVLTGITTAGAIYLLTRGR